MKCPKYIRDLINKRVRLAEKLCDVDYQLSDWIDKNHIDVETCDYRFGYEMYINPQNSANRILEAIDER